MDELIERKVGYKKRIAELESQLSAVQQEIDIMHEATCFICENVEYGRNDLPTGWGWLVDDNYSILMCDKCINKWEDRWVLCKTTRGQI